MTHTTQQLDTAIAGYVAGAQDIINRHYTTNYPILTPSVLSIDPQGKRYKRIVVTTDGGKGQRSVFAFIDTTNGDILKPASWKAPAKHARGNVFDADFGLKHTGEHGPHYLR